MTTDDQEPGKDARETPQDDDSADNPIDAVQHAGPAEQAYREEVGNIDRLFSATFSMMGGAVNPLADRINSDHITAIIAHMGRETDRAYGDRKHSRLVNVFFAVFIIVMFVGLCVTLLLLDATGLLRDLLIGLGIFGGGYGLGRFQR